MIKSIGIESIGVTSSSSEMDAGDLLSASMNSGMIGGGSSNVMSSSMVSSASFTSSASQMGNLNSSDNKQMITSTGGLSITHGVSSGSPARFPKLEECAHFHYERVQLGRIHIRLIDESKKNDCNSSLITETASCSTVTARTVAGENFIMKVSAGRSDPFLIRRSLENLKSFDSILHRCVYDRRLSELKDLYELEIKDDEQLEDAVSEYLARFSMIASDTITCGSILTWLQLDNKGRRLPVADRDTMLTINTPAVGAAYGVRKYIAQACDEISIDVGDMISVIDMPSPAESVWWRGKKSLAQKNQYEVGFFPQSCVATIGEKVPRNMPLPAPLVGSLALSPTKPVLRKHGKLISFFRSFILARPSRRRLKQSGIYKERVFSCDLSEHLMNSQQDIPMVLKHCAEFIENYGIVDGIYRLSGITSNIQKLRRAFDEERVPDLTTPEFRHDIHAVSSLLKMYFRELPNPLCTYQLYDHFVEAIQAKVENPEEKVRLIKKVVQKLPPPHYRTLKYLSMHLYKISRYGESTGMTERNIAIVWAPNLLRSPALEAGGVAALKGVGVQAVVTEYLISKCEDIFDDSYIPVDTSISFYDDSEPASLNSVQSAIEIRDHDLFMPMERPKSLNVGGPKLITLEEAQIKQNRVSLESKALPPPNPSGLPAGVTSYIEVGGGPASLPDKYHTVLPLPKNKRKSGNALMDLFRRPRHSTSTHNIPNSTTVLTTTPENATITTISKPSRPITLQKSATVSSPTVAISAPVDMVTSEDMLDAKTSELLTKRSNSIDSLRTAGHSRSVSHDSYFDLLQSPLRGFVTMCPSREMSELGMNFDREEADMRIFSESESLVSSPRVTKENNRRTTKVRIDDSHQNNINPSPKKQPRLNIPNVNNFIGSHHLPVTTPETPEDESYSNKKYKFEEQLNELQYIDSNTPEHTVPSVIVASDANQSNSIFTSVQIHEEPQFERREKLDQSKDVNIGFERYSYPYYGVVQRENSGSLGQNERFSLPAATKMTVDDEALTVIHTSENSLLKSHQEKPSKILRNSYLEATSSTNDILRHTMDSENVPNSKSKLSINTPQSEQQSPSYSLLVTSTTSSDNSSMIDMKSSQQSHFKSQSKEINKFDDRPSTLELHENSIDRKISEGNVSQLSTTTTSQSLTPSDIAYSQMQKNGTTEVTPKSDSDNFETLQGVGDLGLEHAFSTYEYIRPGEGVNISPIKSGPTTPVRATISITYNLKSPVKEMTKPEMGNDYEEVCVPMSKQDITEVDSKSNGGLLETNFDTTNVYEQVKFLKSAVSELNDMIDPTDKDSEAMETGEHEVPDVSMQDMASHDSLELEHDEGNLKSMYENVKQPKPPAFYENMDYKNADNINKDNGTLRESGYKEVEFKYEVPTKIEIRSKDSENSNKRGSKSVRQLANKFETSPIDVLPPFDFSQKSKNRESGNLPTPSPTTPNRSSKSFTNKDLSPNITRSLDENAFVREFGSGRKSTILAPVEIKGVLIENNNSSRRKSGDNLKPKMLNQPKKLPGLKQNDPEYCKQSLTVKKDSGPPPIPPKITPTTENRISLIQQNFASSARESSDDERSSHTSSLKMLGSCGKLDRERIERIKEERRNQLQEKFRSESFKTEKDQKVKSKSRSDIRESVVEKPLSTSLRVKSKSRAELPITKVSVDGQEVQLRPLSSARQQQINSLKLDDTKDIVTRKITTETCDSNKQEQLGNNYINERRASRDSIGSLGRKSNGATGDLATKQDKFIMRATDTSTNPSDRMSIKDVAAMFESKSHY